jgi:lipopolysaccharide biosynthesis regulator YciM
MNNLYIAGVILAIVLTSLYYNSNIRSSNSLIQLSRKEDIITLAEKYYLQGDYNRAFESIELAKAEQRSTKRCTLLYGLIRIKKGDYLEGIHYCQQVAKKDKCFPRAISCVAEGYYLINDFTKSLRYISICIVCLYKYMCMHI